MTDDYEIVFEIEEKCEKELKKQHVELNNYIDKIIKYSINYSESGADNHIAKLSPAIQSKLYFETTLFIVKLGIKERALVTIDEDVIFDRLIICLWAFTDNHDYKTIFRKLGESMYQKYLNYEDKNNG